MSLEFIIDGYNVVRHPAFSAAKRFKDERSALIEHIMKKRLCGSPKNKIIAVFDGYPSVPEARQGYANVEIVFALDETADERIKRMIEASANPKNTIVVSDDKEIKFFIKSCGARAASVEEFINGREKSEAALKEKDLLKAELNRGQIEGINQELRKIWLK